MANNITIGANAIVAKAAGLFSSFGLDISNISIIYKVGPVLKSWKPDRDLNGVDSFEIGSGYYLIAKTVMDLSAVVSPPLGNPELTTGVLTDGATVTMPYIQGKIYSWTIGANNELNVTNLVANVPAVGLVQLIQGSGGNHTPVLDGLVDDVNYRLGAGEITILGWFWNGSSLQWNSSAE